MQRRNHQISNIISEHLVGQIIERSQKYHIPKEKIYSNCSKQILNMESSLIQVQRLSPDLQSAIPITLDLDMAKISGQIGKNKTTFKVKQIHQPISFKAQKDNLQKTHKRISKQLTQLNVNSSNQMSVESNQGSSKKLINNKKQQYIFNHNKERNAFSCIVTKKMLDMTDQEFKLQLLKQRQAKNQEEKIRFLRQKKIYQRQIMNKTIQKNMVKLIQKSIKKQKENAPKKYATLITDYDGFSFNFNKNQLSNTVSHYVDMQVEIQQSDSNSQDQKLYSLNSHKQVGLNKQFLNYKDLKILDKQNMFVNSIFRNIKFASIQNNQEERNTTKKLNKSDNAQQNSEQFKFHGKTYKPTKIPLNVFSKIKKQQSWNTHNIKQKVHFYDQSSNDSLISVLKNSSHIKKQFSKTKQTFKSFKSKFNSQLQSQSNLKKRFKNKSTIHLGDMSVVKLLLQNDQKILNKNSNN